MRSFTLDGVRIGPQEPPYLVAELSANHGGDLQRALDTISAAHRCGASAVKLQTYTADTMTIDCDREDFRIRGGPWDGFQLHELYRWAQTPFEWHRAMFEHARRIGITCFSTPFDESAVDLLEGLGAPAYKIASFEAVDIPLIRYAASTGKPLIISTGMADREEIGTALAAARDAGCVDIVLLHCISSYPAPVDQFNLRTLQQMQRDFGVQVGLSDHSTGSVAAIAAVSLGATFIEKHFMLDRAVESPDAGFSIEPEQMAALCADCRDAWRALGTAGYECRAAEAANRQFRRSIYFVQDVPAGCRVQAEQIRRIRPGYGLAPRHFDELIGKRLVCDVQRGTPASWDLFED